MILLMIIGLLINLNTTIVKGIETQEIEKEYINNIKNIKNEHLEKINGAFFEKNIQRPNFYL